MNTQFEVELLPFKKGLGIASQCKTLQLASVMKNSFEKLKNYAKENQLACQGVPYAFYESVDWENLCTQSSFKMFLSLLTFRWSFHCAIPVEQDAPENEEIKLRTYPFEKVAVYIHEGAYQKVGESYKKLYLWMKESGYEAQPFSFELYLNDPTTCKVSELRTKLIIPIK